MKVYDYYNIEVQVNKEVIDLKPEAMTFRLKDSIHNLFCTAEFEYKDVAGLFQEYLALVEGVKVQILYSEDETQVKNRYVVTSDELLETMTKGILNGTVKTFLKHEFFDAQEVVSAAFEDRISRIVRDIANKYRFKDAVINDTGNQDVWYQPQATDARFIRKYLLPYAFSRNAAGTPFFCFIDSANVFHFQSYAALISENPVTTLRLLPEGESVARDKNAIRNISRVRVGSDVTKHLRKREITMISPKDFSLIEEEDSLLDTPSSVKQLPIVGDKDQVTGQLHLGVEGSTTGEKENALGYQAHTARDGYFLDRFRVELPLQLRLTAGKTVMLEIGKWLQGDGSESSLAFRGRYVIEDSEHVWDGEQKSGKTVLIIGRKGLNVPNTYYIKNQLLKN